MASAPIHVQNPDEIQDDCFMNDADDVRRPKLFLDTDSLSSQPSQLSTPNTPNEPLSPRDPSDLVSYYENSAEPLSRPESAVSWRSQLSPTDGQREIYPLPWAASSVERSVPPLNLSLSRNSQGRAVAAGATILDEGADPLDHTLSPRQDHGAHNYRWQTIFRMNDAEEIRPLDTDSLCSQPSQLSTPNTPNEPLSPRAPSDLVNYYENGDSPPSRPESFVIWRSQESPTDGQPEMYPLPWAASSVEPSVPPLNHSFGRDSQRRAVAVGATILEEEADVLQTRPPLQIHVPEPDIVFDGTDSDKCCDLIREVLNYAWKMGKNSDKRWIAEFAVTRFAKGVIAWYSRLPVEVKYDWDKLHHELIETYGPRSPDGTNHSSFIPNTRGGITSMPSTTSPESTAMSSLMLVTPNLTSLPSPLIISLGSSETNAEELEGELDLPEEPRISTGYADIYHGTWNAPNGTQAEVAVKTLRALTPASRSIDHVALRQKASIRLRREILVWTRAKHRNIHPLLGFRSRPRPQLISLWCRHGNLTDYLEENLHLSRFDKLRLIQQAALGLDYLHSQLPPICHADIKPENVLVNDACEAALSDFGLSRLVQDIGTSSGLTTSVSPKGTHNYMARELISGEGPQSSCESDVYAFGGLILTVMSGKPPFLGISVGTITLRVMLGNSPKPEEHPTLQADDPLWDLMRRCWEPDLSARPSIRQVLVELETELATAIEQDPPHSVM